MYQTILLQNHKAGTVKEYVELRLLLPCCCGGLGNVMI